MLRNFTPVQYHIDTTYELVFDDGRNNGYGFPCDKYGNLAKDINPCAMENYKWCMENPDKFKRFNEIITLRHRVRDDAHGTCTCGQEVYLFDQYYGACECEKCGKWYNLFGEEILPPSEWEEEFEEDY